MSLVFYKLPANVYPAEAREQCYHVTNFDIVKFNMYGTLAGFPVKKKNKTTKDKLHYISRNSARVDVWQASLTCQTDRQSSELRSIFVNS